MSNYRRVTMKTRKRILDAALELFNRQGYSAVSTHHIAAACGISPGNLYYHFRNKEDIVRVLFSQALDFVGSGTEDSARPDAADPSGLERALAFLSELNWRYSFLKRDLPIILLNDPLLRERFHAVHREQLSSIQTDLEQAMVGGVIRAFTEPDIVRLSRILWLVALFWPTFLDVGGEEYSRENLNEGAELIRLLYSLLLTDRGKQVMEGEAA